MLTHELYVCEKMREFEADRVRRVDVPCIARERPSLARSAVTGLGRLLVRAGEALARTPAVDAVNAEPHLAKQA